MHTAEEQSTRGSNAVLEEIESEDDEDISSDRSICPFVITVCDVDLPAFISNGVFYLQAPLFDVLKACHETLYTGGYGVEVRVSGTWGTALPPADHERAVHRARMAFKSLVRSGRFP